MLSMRNLFLSFMFLFLTAVGVLLFLELITFAKLISYVVLGVWGIFAIGLFLCFFLFQISEFGAFWKKDSKYY